MIEFKPKNKDLASPLIVMLDKRVIGEIQPVYGGWQYFPTGKKTGGLVYPVQDQCKISLTDTSYNQSIIDYNQSLKQYKK